MNDEACEAVITGPSQEWVATLTRQLVDDRLAACWAHHQRDQVDLPLGGQGARRD